jgi:phosphoserine phosphatase RsbX
MPEVAVDASTILEWGVGARTLPGERHSGDLHLVKAVSKGVLVAVVDGLGHGEEAATAARTALTILDQHADDAVLALLERCHWALKGSRGVVMSLAFIDPRERALTWAGIGNVEGLLVHGDSATRAGPGRVSLVTRGGIVGSELPRVRAQQLPLTTGDLLFLATDGIREGFLDGLAIDASSQHLAERILARSGKDTDDALILVARYRRYRGGAPSSR